MPTKCEMLESEMIKAAIEYDFATKAASGQKVSGAFYTVVFDKQAEVNLGEAKGKYEAARTTWLSSCT